MDILQLLLAAIILGILYKKMLKWGPSKQIGKKQAVILIIFGVIATILTFLFALAIGISISNSGHALADIESLPIRALSSSFLGAGLTEEVSKLLMILLAIKLFKPHNVYDYSLIGAGVGMGFTLHEELLYGGSLIGFSRFLSLAFHMILGIIMGKYIGIGIYNKKRALSYVSPYIKALIIPIVIHTIYDALTVYNPAVTIENLDDELIAIWIIAALVCIILATIGQIIFIKRLKKDAEIYTTYDI